MFTVNDNKTYGNHSHVKGSYMGLPFVMDYFYSEHFGRVSGEFTEAEKAEIIAAFETY